MDMELTVADVECGLRFYEDKTYDDIAVVDNISIKTDISGSYEQEIGGGGIVLYDDKGVKIIEKGIVKNSGRRIRCAAPTHRPVCRPVCSAPRCRSGCSTLFVLK